MAKAIFIQNQNSIYDDRAGVAYHFPKTYLSRVRKCLKDWIILYQSGQGGGYFATYFVDEVKEDPNRTDHYYAFFASGENAGLGFNGIVSITDNNGHYFEENLNWQSAVRVVSDRVFDRILQEGIKTSEDGYHLPRTEQLGFAEPLAPYNPKPFDRGTILASRQLRDQKFRENVIRAYGGRCAITGLQLRNGGGKAEVQAAHIRPVARGGHDVVTNALALTGTVHWMFDRGLVSVDDDYRLVVAGQYRDRVAEHPLIEEGRRLYLPANDRDFPSQIALGFHRQNIFHGLTGSHG